MLTIDSHFNLTKHQSPYYDLWGPIWFASQSPPLWTHFLPLFPLLTLLQSHWPPHHSSNTQSPSLSQSLWSCCSAFVKNLLLHIYETQILAQPTFSIPSGFYSQGIFSAYPSWVTSSRNSSPAPEIVLHPFWVTSSGSAFLAIEILYPPFLHYFLLRNTSSILYGLSIMFIACLYQLECMLNEIRVFLFSSLLCAQNVDEYLDRSSMIICWRNVWMEFFRCSLLKGNLSFSIFLFPWHYCFYAKHPLMYMCFSMRLTHIFFLIPSLKLLLLTSYVSRQVSSPYLSEFLFLILLN